MRRRSACLGSADMQDPRLKVDLIPTEIHQFACPEAMPEAQKDHGGVPVARGCFDQSLDLVVGQVLAGPVFDVLLTSWRLHCRNFAGWRDQLEMRICHGFPRSVDESCRNNTCFTDNGLWSPISLESRGEP